jgi:SAM-dependent methyltransferase
VASPPKTSLALDLRNALDAAIREVADVFGGAARDTILFENFEKHRFECAWLLANTTDDCAVVDIGGGLGVDFIVLRRLGRRQRFVVADRFLEFTDDNRMGSSTRGTALLRAADVEVIDQDIWVEPRLAFDDASFDTALCLDVFEHLPGHPLRQLAEMRRLLKPGGRVLTSGPNGTSLKKRIDLLAGRHPYIPFAQWTEDVYHLHVREYSPAEHVQLLERAGFHVEERVMSRGVWITRSRNRYWRRRRSALSPVLAGLYAMRFAEALLPRLRHTVYCSAVKESR